MSHETIPGIHTEFKNEDEVNHFASMGSQTLIDTLTNEYHSSNQEIEKELKDIKDARKEAALKKPQEDLAAAEQRLIEVEAIPGVNRDAQVKVKEWTSHRDRNTALEQINNYIDQEGDIDKELTKELAENKELWEKLGGKAIEAAQLAVEQLNFKSNATDHVYAKTALRDAKDNFVKNVRAELTAAQAAADKAKSPATPDNDTTPTTGDTENGKDRPTAEENAQKFYGAVNQIVKQFEEDGTIDSSMAETIRSRATAPSNKDYYESGDPVKNAGAYVALVLSDLDREKASPAPSGASEGTPSTPEHEESKERLKPKDYRVGELAVVEYMKRDRETHKVIGTEFHELQVAARTTDGEHQYVYLMDPQGKVFQRLTVDQLNEVREKAKNEGYKEHFRLPEELDKIQARIHKKKLYTPISSDKLKALEWEIIDRNPGDSFTSGRPEGIIRNGVAKLWKQLEQYQKAVDTDQGIDEIAKIGGLPRRQQGGERGQGGGTPTERPKTAAEWLKHGFLKFNEWDIKNDERLRAAVNAQLDRSEKARNAKAALKNMRENVLSRIGGSQERSTTTSGVKKQVAKMLNNWLNSTPEHPGLRANRTLSRQAQRRQGRRR